MSPVLIVLWIISLIPILLLPYAIALFYQRSFKRRTYPFLFLIALVLYIASSIQYLTSSFVWGNLFFGIGGVMLVAASIRLHNVMTRRQK